MCAWQFGESFDCYALPVVATYVFWDSGTVT
jgi:hypothetical protein